MRSLARTIVLVGISVTFVGLLSGCSPDSKSAVRLEDGGLVLRLCYATSGNVIRVAATKPGADGHYLTIWKAKSRTVMDVPTMIRFDSPIPGFEQSSPLGSITEYDYLDLAVEEVQGGKLAAVQSAVFKVADIGTKYWLTSGGTRSTRPCEN